METSQGEQLLSSVLQDVLPDKKEMHRVYADRLQDRRLQLANPDRSRPKGEGEAKLKKRRKRVKIELAQIKRLRIQQTRVEKSQIQAKQKELAQVKKEEKKGKPDKTNPLSRVHRKKLGLESVDPDISYEHVLPLHTLWCSYVQQLLNISHLSNRVLVPNPHFSLSSLRTPSSGPVTTLQASLIKADLCGARIEIVRSSNPSLCTLSGLVVKETERTLLLVQPNQKGYKTIPKHNTVFALDVPLPDAGQSLRFELHGNHMQHTLPARVTRKYKARPTIDF